MATYASLTDQQKADLASYDTFLRKLFASLAMVYKDCNADIWAQFKTDRIDSLLPTIDATEVIPNSTSMENAVDLVQSDFATLVNIAATLRSTQQTNFGLLVKAIGTNVN